MRLDTVIQGGTIVTADDTYRADVGIVDGRIAVLSLGLEAPEVIDASGKYVMPAAKAVEVYPSEVRRLNERALFTADAQARLLVLEEGRRALRVRDMDGREGWVRRDEVVRASQSALFEYGEAHVLGHLDEPMAIIILDGDGTDETPIRLDRSFKEALRENTDRETTERLALGL